MNAKIAIAVGAAALLVGAGAAQAAVGGRYAEPSQPIAYGQLNAYLKASPSQRAHRDFTNGQTAQAATGQSMDTSASTMNNPPPAAAPASTMNQPSASQTMNPDNNLNMPANADTSNTTAPSTPDVNEPTASQK